MEKKPKKTKTPKPLKAVLLPKPEGPLTKNEREKAEVMLAVDDLGSLEAATQAYADKNYGHHTAYIEAKYAHAYMTRVNKYRAYPTAAQQATFDFWERKCRFLYNFLVEVRLSAYKGYQPGPNVLNGKYPDRVGTLKLKYPEMFEKPAKTKEGKDYIKELGAFELMKFITVLKEEYPELKLDAVPTPFMETVCNNVHQAFDDYKRNRRAAFANGTETPYPPGFKGRHDEMSMTYAKGVDVSNKFKVKQVTATTAEIYGIPKLVRGVPVRYHRPVPGRVSVLSLIKDVGKWYLAVTYVTLKPVVEVKNTKKVGIDIGVTRNVQLSDGTYFNLPIEDIKVLEDRASYLQWKHRRKMGGDFKRALEDATGKKFKQSLSYRKANAKVAKLRKKAADMRRYHSAILAHDVATKYGVIHLENLSVKNMTKSAKGTAEKPGKNVKQKQGLNKSLLRVAPYQLKQMIKAKADELGGVVFEIDPKYTSQTCSSCGYKSRDNRPSQSEFRCLGCGFACNADLNAAINIRDKQPNEVGEKEQRASRSVKLMNMNKLMRRLAEDKLATMLAAETEADAAKAPDEVAKEVLDYEDAV